MWRWYTVPKGPDGPFENPQMEMAAKTWSGDWWKTGGGGGTVWDGITYDPQLDLLFIGVGNGGPWPAEIRDPGGKGDHLFLSSIVALKPDTGEYVWHYQETQRDSWDYTAVPADDHRRSGDRWASAARRDAGAEERLLLRAGCGHR